MNYLAHALLSFDHPEILAGNMISDYIKGKKKYGYSPNIQKGILLHRLIDTFTDEHPITREAKKIYQPDYGLYSRAFLDISFDHFIATDPKIFRDDDLERFTRKIYSDLENQIGILPDNFLRVFPYMKTQNWLLNYRHEWGMENSFRGLVHRASFLNDSETIFILFKNNYSELKDFYEAFFPLLRNYALKEFHRLIKTDDFSSSGPA